MSNNSAISSAFFNEKAKGTLPGLVGLEVTSLDGPRLQCRLPIRPELLALNGFLHAASVVALADTACGYGCVANLPDGASGFTTIELKSNFLGTARQGAVTCKANLVHGGKTTQVWDAKVVDESNGKVICLFRCTQMILYPKPPAAK
jgi:uncharacterized protein (TIGR00369 family)